jgi:hypothetical protein
MSKKTILSLILSIAWTYFIACTAWDIANTTARIFLEKDDWDTMFVIQHFIVIGLSGTIARKLRTPFSEYITAPWSVSMLVLIILGLGTLFKSYSMVMGVFFLFIGATLANMIIIFSIATIWFPTAVYIMEREPKWRLLCRGNVS